MYTIQIRAVDLTKGVIADVGRNLSALENRYKVMPGMIQGATNRLGSMLVDTVINSTQSWIENQITGIQSQFGAAQAHYKNLTMGAAGLTSASGLQYQESISLLEGLNSDLGKIAAKLPGANADYINSLNMLADDIAGASKTVDGSLDKEKFKTLSLSIAEANTMLAQGAGVDTQMAAGYMSKLIGGNTNLKQILAVDTFEKNVAFKNALLRNLEEQGISEAQWTKLSNEQRIGIINDAYSNSFPQEAKDRLANSIEGVMDGYKSKMLDPVNGTLSLSRKIDGRSTFERITQTLKLIFGEGGTLEQLARISPFQGDGLAMVNKVIDALNGFLAWLNSTLVGINSIPRPDVGAMFSTIANSLRTWFRKIADYVQSIDIPKIDIRKLDLNSIKSNLPKLPTFSGDASTDTPTAQTKIEKVARDIAKPVMSSEHTQKVVDKVVNKLPEPIRPSMSKLGTQQTQDLNNNEGSKVGEKLLSGIKSIASKILPIIESVVIGLFSTISKILRNIKFDQRIVVQAMTTAGLALAGIITGLVKVSKPLITIVSAAIINLILSLGLALVMSLPDIVSSISEAIYLVLEELGTQVYFLADVMGFGAVAEGFKILYLALESAYRIIMLPIRIITDLIASIGDAIGLPIISSLLSMYNSAAGGASMLRDIALIFSMILVRKFLIEFGRLVIESSALLTAMAKGIKTASLGTLTTLSGLFIKARAWWLASLAWSSSAAYSLGFNQLGLVLSETARNLSTSTARIAVRLRIMSNQNYWSDFLKSSALLPQELGRLGKVVWIQIQSLSKIVLKQTAAFISNINWIWAGGISQIPRNLMVFAGVFQAWVVAQSRVVIGSIRSFAASTRAMGVQGVLSNLSGLLARAAAAMSGLSLGGIVPAIMGVVSGLGTFLTGVGGILAPLGALLTGISFGWLVVGVLAITGFVLLFKDQIGQLLSVVWEAIKSIAGAVWGVFEPIIEIFGIIAKLLGMLAMLIAKIFLIEPIKFLIGIIVGIVQVITNIVVAIVNGIAFLLKLILDIIAAPFRAINWALGFLTGENGRKSTEVSVKKGKEPDKEQSEQDKQSKIPTGVKGAAMFKGIRAVNASTGLHDAILSELANKPVGSDLVIANTSENVLTQQQTRQLVSNFSKSRTQPSAGNSSNTFNPVINVTVAGTNSSPEEIASKVLDTIEKMYSRYKTQYAV